MSQTGFYIDRSAPGVEDLIVQVRGVNGTQYQTGDACYISKSTGGTTGGLVIQADSQTVAPAYVFLAMMTDKSMLRPAVFNQPSSLYEYLELIEVAGTPLVLSQKFTAATFDGVACNANTNLNQVVFTGAGATNDLTGGQVYVNGQQRTILSDVVAAGVHTLTVAPAFPFAPTTGMTLRAVPWSRGYNGGVKLQATNPQQGISMAVADKTGGHIFIYDVDLMNRIVYVRFSGVAQNP